MQVVQQRRPSHGRAHAGRLAQDGRCSHARASPAPTTPPRSCRTRIKPPLWNADVRLRGDPSPKVHKPSKASSPKNASIRNNGRRKEQRAGVQIASLPAPAPAPKSLLVHSLDTGSAKAENGARTLGFQPDTISAAKPLGCCAPCPPRPPTCSIAFPRSPSCSTSRPSAPWPIAGIAASWPPVCGRSSTSCGADLQRRAAEAKLPSIRELAERAARHVVALQQQRRAAGDQRHGPHPGADLG